MGKKSRWETRQVQCPEEERVAKLLLEWRDENGIAILKSISCDNPRLQDLDLWDCRWTCWDNIIEEND